jgi:hypothetical protein
MSSAFGNPFPTPFESDDDDTIQESGAAAVLHGYGVVAESLFFVSPTPSPPPDVGQDHLVLLAQQQHDETALRRHNSNRVHGPLADDYRHLERYYDGEDNDAFARINWQECNGVDLWNLLTSKFLATGRVSSMAFSLRECIKNLKELAQTSQLQRATFTESLKQTNDKHLPAQPALKKDFLDVLSNGEALSSIQRCMHKYHQSRKIKIKDGLFSKFTDLQSNTVRIALFMASVAAQSILHAMSNPDQSKRAIDNPETRVAAIRSALYKEFTDLVNSSSTPDTCIVHMMDFCGFDADCTERRGEPMPLVQVASIMRDIKTHVSNLVHRFNSSGKGLNGADSFDRDLDFYENYARGDAVWFAIYLAWGHGRQIPAWNSIVLPEDEQLDTFDMQQSAPPSKKSRVSAPTPDIIEPAKLDTMIEMQTKFFEYALGGGVNSDGVNSASTRSSAGTSKLSAYDTQLSLLQRLRSDESLTIEQRKKVDDKFEKVLQAIVESPV